MVNLLGSGLGIPLAAGMAWAWKRGVATITLDVHFNAPEDGWGRGAVLLLLLTPVVFLALLFLVHELCHALATPRCGFSRDTVIGAWPRKLLFYAAYMKEMSRAGYLVLAAAPFAVLSVAPLLVGLVTQRACVLWPLVSVANALCSGGDLLLIYLVAAQLPAGTVIRNQGWNSWWRKT